MQTIPVVDVQKAITLPTSCHTISVRLRPV